MNLKEQFIVTRIFVDRVNTYPDTNMNPFITVNENSPSAPPTFDTYKEAEDWIRIKGEKAKWYQIQKFLMPI